MLAASSNIVSNTNSKEEEVLNATTVTTNVMHPSGEMLRGNLYCSQAVWNHRLGMISHVSFFNTYLGRNQNSYLHSTNLNVSDGSLEKKHG
jgi:hypothetical protein